jgi:hypothetical protein
LLALDIAVWPTDLRSGVEGFGLFRLHNRMRVSGTLFDQRIGLDRADAFESTLRLIASAALWPIERVTLGPLPRGGRAGAGLPAHGLRVHPEEDARSRAVQALRRALAAEAERLAAGRFQPQRRRIARLYGRLMRLRQQCRDLPVGVHQRLLAGLHRAGQPAKAQLVLRDSRQKPTPAVLSVSWSGCGGCRSMAGRCRRR